jgi:hypothetical protein
MSAFAAWAGTSVGLAILAGLALCCGWLALRVVGIRRGSTVPDLLVAVSVAAIVVLTLRTGSVHRPLGTWQLRPFADLMWALPLGPREIALALADLVGNVVLFIPFGGALAIRWPRLGAWRVLLASVALSLVIETTQSFMPLGRTAQSTDVLMNGLGGWLGWLLIDRLRRSAWVSDVARRRR